MAPPPFLVVVKVHPLLTLRTPPERVRVTHPHFHFTGRNLQRDLLHAPRFGQTQDLLIQLEIFHAPSGNPQRVRPRPNKKSKGRQPSLSSRPLWPNYPQAHSSLLKTTRIFLYNRELEENAWS